MIDRQLCMASKGKKPENWIIESNASYYLPPTFHCAYSYICFVTGATGLYHYLQYPIPQKSYGAH